MQLPEMPKIEAKDMNTDNAYKFKRYGAILLLIMSIAAYVMGQQLNTLMLFSASSYLYAQSVEDRLFLKGVLP